MHGLIFSELEKYVNEKHDPTLWRQLLRRAGTIRSTYLIIQTYPDEEAVKLFSTLAEMTNTPLQDILKDFGEFIVTGLMSLYGVLVEPDWKTLDLIEHAEETIHRVVRMRHQGAAPPQLKCERINEHELRFIYTSARQMCSIAKGISQGIARHFGETLIIEEITCMLHGDAHCEMTLKVKV